MITLLPEWREAHENRIERRTRRAAGAHIDRRGEWQVFATLTFPPDFRTREGHIWFRNYCRAMAKKNGEHLDVAWAWGSQKNETIHFHALFKTRDSSSRVLVPNDFDGVRWPGHVLVEPPTDQKKAADYMAKWKHDLWEVNVICPRKKACKKPRCRVAPFPWPTVDELMTR